VQNPTAELQAFGVGEGRTEEDELEVEELSVDREDEDDSAEEDVGDGVAEDDTTSTLEDDVEDGSTDEELVMTETVSPAEPVVQVVVTDDATGDEKEAEELVRVDTLLDEDTPLQLPKPS
jgi:hypothetical protein